MSQYRYWSNVQSDGVTIRYAYDGPEDDADAAADIELVAERVQNGPTQYYGYIEWHVRLRVDGECVHDFAESDPEAIPAGSKADARAFASRWVMLHPRPLSAVGMDTNPAGSDTTTITDASTASNATDSQ